MTLKVSDVKPGMKLKSIWYTWMSYQMEKPFGLTPRYPKLNEVVTVERVVKKIHGGPRVFLKEYWDAEGFLLQHFDSVDEIKP